MKTKKFYPPTVAACLLWVATGFASSAQDRNVPLTETGAYESWSLTCSVNVPTACEIGQNVADAEGRPVMQLQVRESDRQPNTYTLAVRFPANIATTSPIVWSAGETAVELTLRACLSAGCIADARLENDTLAAILSTRPDAQTHFRMTSAEGAAVAVPLSLMGFARAWSAMVERLQ
jgi:invasion protein IalB